MSSFRRWYFYVVALISLQAVTWAVIALLRNLILPTLFPGDRAVTAEVERIAFQISVILVGLPMYLFHWRRTERSPAGQPASGQISVERTLYLYLMLTMFLIPTLFNAHSFIQSLLRILSGIRVPGSLFESRLPDNVNLVYTAVAILVLAVMSAYHLRLLRTDQGDGRRDFVSSELYRLFLYAFSTVGLVITSGAAASLIRWLILASRSGSEIAVSHNLVSSLAELFVGLPLWLISWSRAQELYRSGGIAEKTSLLRKIYIYAAIFFAVLATVGALTALLAGLFRQVLALEPISGGGAVTSTLVVAAAVWAYHALVLREDTQELPIREEQAGLRRLYRYLVAGVGLLALLVGLGGVLGVLFDTSGAVVSQQREDLSWFAATLLAGLAVWIIPWRLIQQETAEPPPAGAAARASTVRRFYLFFFLMLATLTFLIAAIFILSRVLTVLLGEHLLPGEIRSLGLAAAYMLMAAAVWLYHGWLLRGDNELLEDLQREQVKDMRVVVVDDGNGRLGRHLMDKISTSIAEVQVAPLGLTASAAAEMEQDAGVDVLELIAGADIIIGPWSMAAPHAGPATTESIQAAIAASPAKRLLLPRPAAGWQWVGKEKWNAQTAADEAARAVEEIILGDMPLMGRPVTPAMIALLIISTILILFLIANLLDSVLPLF